MNYYLVTAKCGHVGKGKYYEVEFPICALSKSDAAQICLRKPKVKKHLKNAITCVREINEDEYLSKKEDLRNNKYVHSHSKREILDYLLCSESLLTREIRKKKTFESRKERVAYQLRKQRGKEEYAYALHL